LGFEDQQTDFQLPKPTIIRRSAGVFGVEPGNSYPNLRGVFRRTGNPDLGPAAVSGARDPIRQLFRSEFFGLVPAGPELDSACEQGLQRKHLELPFWCQVGVHSAGSSRTRLQVQCHSFRQFLA